MVVFPHLWPPKIFFKNLALSLFMQKIRKNQWTVSEIFKEWLMDQRTRAITEDPLRRNQGPKHGFGHLSGKGGSNVIFEILKYVLQLPIYLHLLLTETRFWLNAKVYGIFPDWHDAKYNRSLTTAFMDG